MPSAEVVKILNAQVPKLMGNKAVAKAIGVKPSNLGRVARLPAHAQTLDSGRVWRADVIKMFVRERAREAKRS